MIFKFCAAAQNFLKIELVRQYAAFNAVFCPSGKSKGSQYAAFNAVFCLNGESKGSAVCRK